MGNQNCSTPLLPHVAFPPVLSRLGTRQRLVKLQLHAGFWSHCQLEPLEIRDATTNLTMFRVPTSLRSKSCSKRLLDMYNAPVASLQLQSQTHTTATFAINPSGFDDCSSPVLCKVQLNRTPTASMSVHTTWQQINNHASAFSITCEGDWINHQCDFWLEIQHNSESSVQEARSRIAAVRKEGSPNGRKQSRFTVEIAAGVDVALVLLICAAMDEASTKHFDMASSAIKEPPQRFQESELALYPLPTKAIRIPV